MNLPEARSLLMLIAALDRRSITDDMVQAWAGILEDIPIEDAVWAAREWMKTNPDKTIMPGHISGAVKARRALMQSYPTAGRTSCRLPGCNCTHDAPCEAGWIEADDGKVFGCPNCRPAMRALQVQTRSRVDFQRSVRDLDAREAARNTTAWDD